MAPGQQANVHHTPKHKELTGAFLVFLDLVFSFSHGEVAYGESK